MQVTIGKHKSAPPLRIGLERAGLTGVNRLALPGLSPSLKLRVQHFVIDVCQVSQRGLVGGVELVLPQRKLGEGRPECRQPLRHFPRAFRRRDRPEFRRGTPGKGWSPRATWRFHIRERYNYRRHVRIDSPSVSGARCAQR